MLSVLTTKQNNNNNNNEQEKNLEVISVFIALMVVMVSWVYTYPQTHQVVCIKYVQLFICQTYLNNMV